jgi:hypothetical protein
MGGNWYGRANEGLFEVPKPLSTLGIGIDNLPDAVKNSTVFTGNDLAMLANIEALPENIVDGIELSEDVHEEVQQFLLLDAVEKAWQKLIKTKY